MHDESTKFDPTALGIDPAAADRSKVLTYIFALAIGIRLVHLIALYNSPIFEFLVGDAAKYSDWGRDIAHGNWYGDQVFYQAPLYPYFLGLIYAVLGESLFAVRLVQVVVGAFSCSLLAAATWNMFSRQAGIIAGVCMALFAPSIFLEALVQKSILDLFFICMILWLMSRIVIYDRLSTWFWLGIVLALLCLARENAIALIPVVAVWSLLRQFHFKSDNASRFWVQRLCAITQFAVGIAIVLTPIGLRNYSIGGEFHITTSQLGPNFYIGNNPSADGYYHPLRIARGDARYEQKDAISIAETESGRKLTAGEVSDFFMTKSLTFIQQNPGQWFALLGKKALLACNSTEIIDTEDQYVVRWYSPVLLLTGTVFNFGFLFPWQC